MVGAIAAAAVLLAACGSHGKGSGGTHTSATGGAVVSVS
jgi:hypothetical protein